MGQIFNFFPLSVLKSNNHLSPSINSVNLTQAEKVHFKAFVGVPDVLENDVVAIIFPS